MRTLLILVDGMRPDALENFEAGKVLKNANIKDIAPTVTKLLGVKPGDKWEGKSIL